MTSWNWGILGTGNIARSMASALPHVPDACRLAVASRSVDAAQAFAKRYGFERAYGGYDALLQDPKVDIIYVATPNALHKHNVMAALAAGKHVLCEKPMTLSALDSAACFDMAEAKGLVLMEALWTAFFPAMQKAVSLIQGGTIGTPRHLTANFVSYRDPARHPNLFDPALGGGARADLGIYPLAAALLLAGPIEQARSQSIFGQTGVDEMTAWTVQHQNGALSMLSCGFRADLPVAVRCVGSKGSLEIPQNFHRPDCVNLTTSDGRHTINLPYIGNGYAHEAIAFQQGLSKPQTTWGRVQTTSCAELLQAPDP